MLQNNIFFLENIAITLQQKSIKNIYLRISRKRGLQGQIEVKLTAPSKMNFSEIVKFANRKIDWIKASYQKILHTKLPEISPKKRGRIYFLGKEYLVKIIKDCEKNKLEVAGNLLIVSLKKHAPKQQKSILIKNWKKKEFQKILEILFAKWQKIIGVEILEFRIKEMKSRWGTCNTRVKRIWIALMLSEKPVEIIEYVIVHELVHLLERKHNKIFKNHMTNFLPNWKELEKKLKDHRYKNNDKVHL